MVEQFIEWIQLQNSVVRGLVGGLIIAGLNAIGALVVFIWRNPSRRFLDASLGFAAGVMLAASFTSLILPGIEAGGTWGIIPVVIGLLLGVIMMDFADNKLPHLHMFKGIEGLGHKKDVRIKRVWLLIFAITLHNMPEGLAVGVGLGHIGNIDAIGNAMALMIGIGIQNIPEGFAVAVAALALGKSRSFYAVFTGIRAGLVEIPIAILGAIAVAFAEPLLPYAMGFAAGAMIYVISDEIVPETHKEQQHERIATWGLILGLIIMLTLDVLLSKDVLLADIGS